MSSLVMPTSIPTPVLVLATDLTHIEYLDLQSHTLSHVVAACIESERLQGPVRIIVSRGMRTVWAVIDATAARLHVAGGRDIDVLPIRARATTDRLVRALLLRPSMGPV